MNVHFSFKAAKTPDVEQEIRQQIDKLGRRLQVFRPDLVHLHGAVEPGQTRAGGIGVSLNLRLPSGQMAAQQDAPKAIVAVKAAFREILNQLNAHKDLLRNRHQWHRASKEHRGVPFEQTLAAVSADGVAPNGNGETRQARDVNYFVNTNLERLYRFIDRELDYRVNSGALDANAVSREEVLDETIACALSEDEHRPESLNTQRWLYGLALRSIHAVANRNHENVDAVRIEQVDREQNVSGTDDAYLQYHQYDDVVNKGDEISDQTFDNPESMAISDEFVSQIEKALKGAKPEEREAFVLFVIEGFTLEEIAQVSGRPVEEVKKSVEIARKRVERRLSPGNTLKNELLKHSKTA